MTDADAWAATARDIHDITQVKYRYLRALDTKDWELFASVFVPEATGDYNGLIFDDAAALVDYMRSNMTEGMLSLHQAHHPEIEIDGDTATGRWYLQDKVIIEAFKFVLEGAALYQDRYARTPDGLEDRPHRLPPDLRADLQPRRPAEHEGRRTRHRDVRLHRLTDLVTTLSDQATWTTSTPRSRVTRRPRPGGAANGRRLPSSGPSSGLPASIRPGIARSRRVWITGS